MSDVQVLKIDKITDPKCYNTAENLIQYYKNKK